MRKGEVYPAEAKKARARREAKRALLDELESAAPRKTAEIAAKRAEIARLETATK